MTCLAFSAALNIFGFFDMKGAITTFVLLLGIIVFSPPWWFLVVISSYSIIIAATVYRKDDKTLIRGAKYKEDKKRTYTNVLGKVATPLIASAIGDVGMFVSSICFGVVDSLANEIGVLSRKKPILITTGKPTEPGTSGAISLLGTSASIVVSILMGILISLAGFSQLKQSILLLSIVAGNFGNILDSVLGSLIENRGFLKGWQVNFLSSLAAGVLGHFIYSAINA